MSVLCVCLQAGMQLAGTKRGRQDADSVGARRSAHRASTSSRARALSRQKHQDIHAVGEVRVVSGGNSCVLGDRGGDGSSAAAEAVMMVVVGSGSFATNSWSIGILLSMGECQRALVLALGPSAA